MKILFVISVGKQCIEESLTYIQHHSAPTGSYNVNTAKKIYNSGKKRYSMTGNF